MSDNEHIANAIERWTEELIDIGGRNRLLFYKPLRSGTIDFRPNEGAEQAAVEELLAGSSVRLSEAFPDDEQIMRRGRAIRQKSREHEEEQGIHTLYVGRFFATWSDKPGREPAAPILLGAAEIKALGRLGDDFEITLIDDWELNPSLLHYLRMEFQVEFDEDSLQQAVERGQWDRVLQLFRSAATEVADLNIADRVVLATFSYAKLPLVRDLQGAHDAVGGHQLVAALTGDPTARDDLRNIPVVSFGEESGAIPDDPPPQDEFLILDADGSQSRVINAALQGRNLVVVGPPGTGKSQTIANLIATLTARGKSTLFVAEKRAAIDAVTKRLRNAGLENIVLDLHEGVRSRKQTAEQLAKALEAARYTAEPRVENTHRALSKARDALSGLSQALHGKRNPWGVSVFDLYSQQVSFEDSDVVPAELKNRSRLRSLSPVALDKLSDSMEEYFTTGGALLDRDQRQLWAKAHRERSIDSTYKLNRVDGALDDLLGGEIDDLEDLLQEIAERTGTPIPATIADMDDVLAALKGFEAARAECKLLLGIETTETLADFEELVSELVALERHIELAAGLTRNRPQTLLELQCIVEVCREYEQSRDALAAQLKIDPPVTFQAGLEVLEMLDWFEEALQKLDRAALAADLDELYQDLQPTAQWIVPRIIATLFDRSYRRARTEIRSRALESDTDLQQLRLAVDCARQGMLRWRSLGGGRNVASSWDGRTPYEEAFNRVRSHLERATEHLETVSRIQVTDTVERLRGLGVADSTPILPDCHKELSSLAAPWKAMGPNETATIASSDVERLNVLLLEVSSKLRLVASHVELPPVESMTFDQIGVALNRLVDERALLRRLPRLDGLRRSFTAHGLRKFVQMAASEDWEALRVRRALRQAWVEGVLAEVAAQDARIATFDATRHGDAGAEFRSADRDHVGRGATRVRRAWAEAVIGARNAHPEQDEFVIRESNRSLRHKPMRQIVRKAPDVLTRLKPCWAMSPLVVPQILPLEPLFDVVIFDEASQILPADAVSSLLRGRQAIIAGDSKQLPPTSFFTSTSDDYEEEEEDEEDAVAQPLTSDVESVLDALSSLMPGNSRTLKWHYRSRDERLIAFSNHQIYDSSLTTFPGALAGDCVAHAEVPFSHDSVASGGSNSAEVQRVVDLILEHAKERPTESLGVIAFGLKHAHRVEETLRLVRKDLPHLDEFFSEESDEPFFVKNLERVQGDERDAIILTVGYGRSDTGRMRYNFGPLNREGGYRRLNVAVTRAKRRMTIVSAFSAADMDPDRLRSQGPQMLRDYIAYAASAGRDLGSARRDAEPLNPFELDIKQRLEDAGIPLQAQYGASGYWIDFAAMHPDQPGRPVLAIEADGARYHAAINARERDRLRQEHLERLGWRFHRIWSTEWFRNPEAETRRTVDAWKRAVAEANRRETLQAEPQTPLTAAEDPVAQRRPPPTRRQDCPHVHSPGRPIVEYSARQLDDIVRWARSDGLLHTNDELIRDIAQAMGYRRVGSRIRDHLERAITRVKRRQ